MKNKILELLWYALRDNKIHFVRLQMSFLFIAKTNLEFLLIILGSENESYEFFNYGHSTYVLLQHKYTLILKYMYMVIHK
jgi:hypothetical protein